MGVSTFSAVPKARVGFVPRGDGLLSRSPRQSDEDRSGLDHYGPSYHHGFSAVLVPIGGSNFFDPAGLLLRMVCLGLVHSISPVEI